MPDISLINSLKERFQGEIFQPFDAGYDEVRSIWNAMIDKHPALIARCISNNDVIEAVNFARDNDLALSVRGSGHNVAGNAVCDDGVMIDLSLMKEIIVNQKESCATAQAGVVFGEMDAATQPFGLAVPGGIVSETGIAGLTLGGGFGWLTRRFGFTCDNLISAEIVTANGDLLTANANENSDLFWGIRGGGGNFGIVTTFKYQLQRVGPEVFAGMLFHPLENAKEALHFYREFTAISPDELSVMAVFLLAPPSPLIPEEIHGTPVLAFIVCYSGDIEEGEAVLQPLRDYGSPIADGVKRTEFAAHNASLDAGQPNGKHYYWKSEYITKIADGVIDNFVDYGSRISSPQARLALFQLGGALKAHDEQAMAVSHRDADYVIGINTGWADSKDTDVQVKWTRDLWAEIRPFSSGVYVNFLSEDDGEDRVRAAYGAEKFERLVQLKNKYDPKNFFKLNQNIKPSL